MRSIRNNFLHYPLDFSKFVHEIDLIMKASSRINQNNINLLCNSRTKRIKGYRGRIRILTLCDNGNTCTFGPNDQLIHSRRSKSIRGPKQNAFPGLFKLPCRRR